MDLGNIGDVRGDASHHILRVFLNRFIKGFRNGVGFAKRLFNLLSDFFAGECVGEGIFHLGMDDCRYVLLESIDVTYCFFIKSMEL